MEDLKTVREIYEKNIYGIWREGEKVSYTVCKKSKRVNETNPDNPFSAMFRLSTDDEGIDVEIKVEKDVFMIYIPTGRIRKHRLVNSWPGDGVHPRCLTQYTEALIKN